MLCKSGHTRKDFGKIQEDRLLEMKKWARFGLFLLDWVKSSQQVWQRTLSNIHTVATKAGVKSSMVVQSSEQFSRDELELIKDALRYTEVCVSTEK